MKDRMLTYSVLEDHATGANKDNIYIIFEGREISYAEFFDAVTRAGNWLMKDLGVQKGEIVAVDGNNNPEYLIVWFALEGLGACPALINWNLGAAPLAYCVKVTKSRHLLADRYVGDLVQPVEGELKKDGVHTTYYDREFLENLPDPTPLPRDRRSQIRPDQLRALIFTSGTTGFPKATIITTGRWLVIANSISQYLELKPGDRMYTAMPLYHGAAIGLDAIPSMWAGATIVLSRKFSHQTFWPEIRQSKANILQYVGELCRYLINAPPSPLDRQHNVRMAWGNGMRPDVWERFRERFGIPVINELYAASDGMGTCFNANRGEFGRDAVTLRGALWHWWNGGREVQVRVDIDTQEILRDARTGFAQKCGTNEPGEVLHKVDPAAPEASFAGYYGNQTAGEKRFMRDVFKKGDCWFRSGDMHRVDRDGRVYFVDRLGDTFRWKSENVSTNEVSDVVGKFHQIDETNVYGVQLPHADGRCGCAAVVLADGLRATDNVDWAGLTNYLIATLPRYAVPIFIRVVRQLDYTGTMKLQKGRMRNQGIDVDRIEAERDPNSPSDQMYWLPDRAECYRPFTKRDWEEIKAGRTRL